MNANFLHSCSILWILSASLTPCLGEASTAKPITAYVLDVDTNIKGDFSAVAPELTQALQTAFSAKDDVFNILERSNRRPHKIAKVVIYFRQWLPWIE